MSKRHSMPHSLQFAKLLCWGTFGTLCFRLCTKDLWIFIAALSPAQNNMANPLMNEGFTHVYPFSFKLQPMALEKVPECLPKNLQPRVTQIQRLGCRPFGGMFWLGRHCGQLNLSNQNLKKSGSFLDTWPLGVCSYSAKTTFQIFKHVCSLCKNLYIDRMSCSWLHLSQRLT